MTNIIIGALMFVAGSIFGVAWMCMMNAAKQADQELEEMLKEIQEVKTYES